MWWIKSSDSLLKPSHNWESPKAVEILKCFLKNFKLVLDLVARLCGNFPQKSHPGQTRSHLEKTFLFVTRTPFEFGCCGATFWTNKDFQATFSMSYRLSFSKTRPALPPGQRLRVQAGCKKAGLPTRRRQHQSRPRMQPSSCRVREEGAVACRILAHSERGEIHSSSWVGTNRNRVRETAKMTAVESLRPVSRLKVLLVCVTEHSPKFLEWKNREYFT